MVYIVDERLKVAAPVLLFPFQFDNVGYLDLGFLGCAHYFTPTVVAVYVLSERHLVSCIEYSSDLVERRNIMT